MSFMVGPVQPSSCDCNCNCDYMKNYNKSSRYENHYHTEQSDESYDFNTLRRQWSELSKGFNFPYNKKMTGVFGLALFDSSEVNDNEGKRRYQCKCKEYYQQCSDGRTCLCKACKSAGCTVCTTSTDVNNQKRLMASETICYTCPCGVGNPNRLVYGYQDADYTPDGTGESLKLSKTNNKRDNDIRQRKQQGKDGLINEEDEDRSKITCVKRNCSPTKFFDGTISQVMGEHLGTVYEKQSINVRSTAPTTPESSCSPTSLRGCLRENRHSVCGCSKCSPCSTCVPCSTCTSCNTCGCRSYTRYSSCGKNSVCHRNGTCSPCVPLQRCIPCNIPKAEPDESLSENVEEITPEIVQVKTPKEDKLPNKACKVNVNKTADNLSIKNSPVDLISSKTPDRSSSKSSEKIPKKASNRSPDRSLNKSLEKIPVRVSNRSPDRSIDKSLEKIPVKVSNRSPDRSIDKSIEKILNDTTNDNTDKLSNKLEKVINKEPKKVPDRYSNKSIEKISNKILGRDRISNRSNKVYNKIEKLSVNPIIPYDRESNLTEKSSEASSKSDQDDSDRRIEAKPSSNCSCACYCIKSLFAFLLTLMIIACIFLLWSHAHKTWPFKPKCSTRYHLYHKIKPYKR